jgi:hypothetical protein
MQRNTEIMAMVSIVAFSLLMVGCYAISYKPITITEYDGPKIVAVHEITAEQLYQSAYTSFDAAKRGDNIITIERAVYEGRLTSEQGNTLKGKGITFMEVA